MASHSKKTDGKKKAASSKKPAGVQKTAPVKKKGSRKSSRTASIANTLALASLDSIQAEDETSSAIGEDKTNTPEVSTDPDLVSVVDSAAQSAIEAELGAVKPAALGNNGDDNAIPGTVFRAEKEAEREDEDPIPASGADEKAMLTVEGEVVAIYDSIWTMEDTDTIKVYQDYQGESVILKSIPTGLRSSKTKKYKAIYTAGPYKAVYCKYAESCETPLYPSLLFLLYMIEQQN